MYTFLRSVKRAIGRVRSFFLAPFIIKSLVSFLARDSKKRFPLPLSALMPVLFEDIPYTRFDTHYVYHTAWAARKVKEIGGESHVDISSSLYFSSIVSAFVPVSFYDYRPAHLNLSNLTSKKGDLQKLPFESNSLHSVSCMHTVEHIGLGRYGDPIDPDGDLIAAKELSRVVREGGSLLFVVPIGKPRIQFNAHRVYSYRMVLEMFEGLDLKEFSLIPDDALATGMIYNATEKQADNQIYGCGCFWFTKGAKVY